MNPYHEHLCQLKEDATICIIGANDGFLYEGSKDPLAGVAKESWNYIFIEPNINSFRRLKDYGHKGILLNKAVSPVKQTLELWRVAGKAKKYFESQGSHSTPDRSGLTSVSKERVLSSIKKLVSKYGEKNCIESFQVEALPITSLLIGHTPDVFQIDTEGMDAIIVRHILTMGYKPSVILFEHLHLSEEEIKGVLKFSGRKGYQSKHLSDDILLWI